MRDFNWIPLCFRSLKPIDDQIKRFKCCQRNEETKNESYIRYDDNLSDLNEHNFINIIRRFSVIEGLVDEGVNYSKRYSIFSHEETSEDEHDEEEARAYKRKKSQYSINLNEKFKQANESKKNSVYSLTTQL